jgi:hypothetical protein
MTDYSGFYINNNGINYSKKNNHSQDEKGLYQAMWDVFCDGTPDTYAREKWENVLNGRLASGQITVENGKMKFIFQDGTLNNLTGFKHAMTEILTNGIKPGSKSKSASKSKSKRGGKKHGKKSRRNTSRVR